MYSSEGLQGVFLFFFFTVATAQVTAAEPIYPNSQAVL
jgi:hypothetical protein